MWKSLALAFGALYLVSTESVSAQDLRLVLRNLDPARSAAVRLAGLKAVDTLLRDNPRTATQIIFTAIRPMLGDPSLEMRTAALSTVELLFLAAPSLATEANFSPVLECVTRTLTGWQGMLAEPDMKARYESFLAVQLAFNVAPSLATQASYDYFRGGAVDPDDDNAFGVLASFFIANSKLSPAFLELHRSRITAQNFRDVLTRLFGQADSRWRQGALLEAQWFVEADPSLANSEAATEVLNQIQLQVSQDHLDVLLFQGLPALDLLIGTNAALATPERFRQVSLLLSHEAWPIRNAVRRTVDLFLKVNPSLRQASTSLQQRDLQSSERWRTDYAAFAEAYGLCLRRASCDAIATFRRRTVTWQGTLRSFKETARKTLLGTDSIGRAEVHMTPESVLLTDRHGTSRKLVCCSFETADPRRWRQLPLGAVVTFRAVLGGYEEPVEVLPSHAHVWLDYGELPAGAPPTAEDKDVVSGEILLVDVAAGGITVRLYERTDDDRQQHLTVTFEPNTDITNGTSNVAVRSLKTGDEVDVEYYLQTNIATYVFVH